MSIKNDDIEDIIIMKLNKILPPTKDLSKPCT